MLLGLAVAAIIVGVVGGFAGWARRRVVVVTVSGISMLPAYRAGDRVLVRRASLAALRAGDIVVIQAPLPETGWRDRPPLDGRVDGRVWYIKRAVALPADPVPEAVRVGAGSLRAIPAGYFAVLGDHPASVDSRQLGLVPEGQLLGVVVRRLRHRDAR